jgi:hypothetical protein
MSEDLEHPDVPLIKQDDPTPIEKVRNQHLKVENPKNHQFTGRATASEAEIIKRALQARKKQLGIDENGKYDIVRLALDTIKHIKKDIFSSLKVS